MAHKNNDKSDRIPDYCNDRLSAKEKADFESLLRDDPELLDECRDFQEIQQLYRQIDPAEPPPSDAIFDRISRRVGAPQQVEGGRTAESGRVLRVLRRFWTQLRESIAVPWVLAVAQAAVIVLLLIPHPRQDTYSTLSATDMASTAEHAGINVVFRPDASESDIRSLLHAVHGSISGGPSREGRYVVSIGKLGDLDHAVRTLKQSEIVVFAEPAS